MSSLKCFYYLHSVSGECQTKLCSLFCKVNTNINITNKTWLELIKCYCRDFIKDVLWLASRPVKSGKSKKHFEKIIPAIKTLLSNCGLYIRPKSDLTEPFIVFLFFFRSAIWYCSLWNDCIQTGLNTAVWLTEILSTFL